MVKKIRNFIIFFLLIMISLTNISFAMVNTNVEKPYGPIVEELKSKKVITENFQEIKRIRANLVAINITAETSAEELKTIFKDIEFYIQEINTVKRNLDNNRIQFKDSFPDAFFSEQILFIGESYLLCLRQQQNLILALQQKKTDAKKLFYSSYLIPVYFYLNLGDQMTAYIDTYFVIS